jgi:hypothetical protein
MNSKDKARLHEVISRGIFYLPSGSQALEAAAEYLCTGAILRVPDHVTNLQAKWPTADYVAQYLCYLLRDIARNLEHVRMDLAEDVIRALEAYEQHYSCGAH